ncbi:hypothetical protein [Shouchella clausii]|uniref:Uncharacterized protein n=1 Tax=Shouchella clausii TaxID=79880 RepID=A0A268NXX7_SHOCL|nr:hypothetical protein [Shouchella clausii]PAE88362.1 hypothetical protein CHH72_13890 [Shouchella clausii]
MGRKRYFVTIDMAMMRLSTTKTPDNSIQYEIYATDEEADKIKALLEQIRSEDFREEQVFQHPFQEKKADQEKEATQNELQELYQIIYDLGTIETKEVVKDIK